MLREDFLQQNAYSDVDATCPPEKQLKLLEAHILFHDKLQGYIKGGGNLDDILEMPIREKLAGLRNYGDAEFEHELDAFTSSLEEIGKTT